MTNNKSVAKSAAIITLGFSASRILGYVLLKSLAYVFGSNYQTDAYVAIFNVIDLLYFLLAGGALSAAFIPVFTEILSKEGKEKAWVVASKTFNILIAVTFLGLLCWEIFTPILVKLIAPGFDKKTTLLCILLTRITLPMVLFTVTSAFCAAILNSFKHFAAPTYAYVFYNLPIIAATFIFGPKIGIIGLPFGVLIGALGLVLIQIPVLIKQGIKYFFIFQYQDVYVKKMIKLFLPAMLGLSISQFNLVMIPQFFASQFSHGVVTYFNYANRVIMLPFGIFAVAIATAVFPNLSEHIQKNDLENFKKTLVKGINATLFLILPSTAFLIVLSNPVIKLLYYGGKFKDSDINTTAQILMYYSIGLLALSLLQTITRGFYSRQDTATPVKIGIISLPLNLILGFILTKTSLGFNGIPLATSITLTFNLIILFFILRKQLNGIMGKFLFVSFLKIFLGTLICAGISYFLFFHLVNIFPDRLSFTALNLLISTGCGFSIYLIFCILTKVEEAKIVLNMVVGKMRKIN